MLYNFFPSSNSASVNLHVNITQFFKDYFFYRFSNFSFHLCCQLSVQTFLDETLGTRFRVKGHKQNTPAGLGEAMEAIFAQKTCNNASTTHGITFIWPALLRQPPRTKLEDCLVLRHWYWTFSYSKGLFCEIKSKVFNNPLSSGTAVNHSSVKLGDKPGIFPL